MGRIYRGRPDKTTGRSRYGIDTIDPETGRRMRRLVGTREQAQRALAKTEEQAAEVRWFGAPKREMTIAGMRDLHLSTLVGRSSHDAVAHYWLRVIEFLGADRPVSTLTPKDLIEFRGWMLSQRSKKRPDRTIKAATVNLHLSVLSTGLNLAVDEGAIAKAPIPRRWKLAEKNERDHVVPESRIAQMVAVSAPDLRMAIILAAELGLRRSEITRLRRSDVSLDANTARVQFSKTDRGRSHGRVVPLTPRARAAIEAWPHESLCRWKSNSISKLYHELTTKLGCAQYTFHDLRHTCATRLAASGVDVFALMRAMGWTNIKTASRYIHTRIG